MEEKNVNTMSANKLNTLKELLIDIYLNVVRGVKIVWHFSDKSTGDFYYKLVSTLLSFRVEYWVGPGIPSP
ncbi:MAG: hypothetical protein QW394_10225 [Thermofilaceae archaeon]